MKKLSIILFLLVSTHLSKAQLTTAIIQNLGLNRCEITLKNNSAFISGLSHSVKFLWGDNNVFPNFFSPWYGGLDTNLYTHKYANPGQYKITMIVGRAAGAWFYDTVYLTINVVARCFCNTDFKDSVVGLTHYFKNVADTTSGNFSCKWTFGDGDSSNATNPIHTYLALANNIPVTQTITDSNINGVCSPIGTKYYDILPCSASFNVFSSITNGCQKMFYGSKQLPSVSGIWNFGNGITTPFINDSIITHTYANDGTYYVTLTLNDNTAFCNNVANTQIASVTNCYPAAVNDYDNLNSIQFYPNPVLDYLEITNSENIKGSIDIINLQGQTVITSLLKDTKIIKVSHLAKGQYLIKLSGVNGFKRYSRIIKM